MGCFSTGGRLERRGMNLFVLIALLLFVIGGFNLYQHPVSYTHLDPGNPRRGLRQVNTLIRTGTAPLRTEAGQPLFFVVPAWLEKNSRKAAESIKTATNFHKVGRELSFKSSILARNL